MGYNRNTGEYMTLVYGGKAYDFPGSPFKSHGALGFVLTSANGISWRCKGSTTPDGNCDMRRPTTIDHDDGSITWDSERAEWVNAQIVIQDKPPAVLPSGQQLTDNSPGRRVVGFRTSTDGGTSWTCVPSYLGGGNPFCPMFFSNVTSANAVLPDDSASGAIDPPELQFYRARPWRYGDRWIAAVYNYAPWPLTPGKHGPHMGSEWWVNKGRLADAGAWERPYRWQRFWRQSRV